MSTGYLSFSGYQLQIVSVINECTTTFFVEETNRLFLISLILNVYFALREKKSEAP